MEERFLDSPPTPARDSLAALRQRIAELPPEHRSLVEEVLQVSSAAIEELQITRDELCRQNEELATAHGELATERARLQAIIECTPEGVVAVDSQSRVVLTNPTADELFAQTISQGTSLVDGFPSMLCYPDDTPYEPCDLPLVRSALQGETSQDDGMLLCLPNGQRWELSVNTAPILDSQGKREGAVGIFQDVTDRREAQRALRHYADRVRILHDIGRTILTSRSGRETARAVLSHLRQLLPFVRASVATFDLDAGEVSLYATLPDGETRYTEGWRGPLEWVWFVKDLRRGQIHLLDDLTAIESSSPLVKALQADGVVACANVPLVAYGGTIGVLSLGLAKPGLESTEQSDVLCEVADELALAIVQARLNEQITRHTDELERRVGQRTAALRASQAQLRTVLESAPIGIGVIDTEDRLIQSNSALQEILGYTREELRGARLTAFVHPDDVAAELARFGELRTGKQDCYEVEHRLNRKDGKTVWARVNVSLMRGDRRQRAFAVGIVRDITQQKEAQEVLVQAEKLSITGRLAASLAHEINNPLQAVIGCLGLAESKLARGEDINRYLEVAHTELRRAARIVARLRNLHRRSRPEDRQITDMNALLERVLTVSSRQCQSRGIEVALQVAADVPPVMAVPDRMEQVFLNLVLNAVEALPRNGRLEISAVHTDRPSGVSIRFADNGVGIPPEALPHLFEPFYTTRPDGVGLGLFVTRNIVEEHEGRIEVESTVGKGTTFTVWLPT
jgi:PAS domain S-box-containing protein